MRKTQLTNSFTIEEVKFLKQLFIYLSRNHDIRILIRQKSFRLIYKKFNKMYEKWEKAQTDKQTEEG